MKLIQPLGRRAGFSLVELLTVIAIISILIVMSVQGFAYGQRVLKRSTTETLMEAIKSGLQNYQRDFGEYPNPNRDDEIVIVDGKEYNISSAKMLYQAITGDGYGEIYLEVAPQDLPSEVSDGKIEGAEHKNVKYKDYPSKGYITDGYYMVDGYGRPFQYIPTKGKQAGQINETINTHYDLWSYAEDFENTKAKPVDGNINNTIKEASIKWIKNW
jgi:prepilin-type N-terminal cleavage/methylation domain-containing protein